MTKHKLAHLGDYDQRVINGKERNYTEAEHLFMMCLDRLTIENHIGYMGWFKVIRPPRLKSTAFEAALHDSSADISVLNQW